MSQAPFLDSFTVSKYPLVYAAAFTRRILVKIIHREKKFQRASFIALFPDRHTSSTHTTNLNTQVITNDHPIFMNAPIYM